MVFSFYKCIKYTDTNIENSTIKDNNTTRDTKRNRKIRQNICNNTSIHSNTSRGTNRGTKGKISSLFIQQRNYPLHHYLFIELHVFIQTFGIRYGHLYNYNFGSEEFFSLSQDITPTLNYFSQILMKIKEETMRFSSLSQRKFTSFLNTFGKVIFQLSTELKKLFHYS